MGTSVGTPTPADQEWDFEKRGRVGIWKLAGWEGWADEQLESASEHYRDRASEDDIDATIAVFGDKTTLSKETQEYMGSGWSENADYADVDRVGFVSEGITAMAVKSQIETEAETEDFDTLDAALDWAQK